MKLIMVIQGNSQLSNRQVFLPILFNKGGFSLVVHCQCLYRKRPAILHLYRVLSDPQFGETGDN